MKVHPRNEGTTSLDIVLLCMMPASIAVLLVLITYMAIDSVSLAAQ